MTIPAKLHDLTGAYVLDALDPAEQEAFERHLPECPDCGCEVRELRKITAELALAVPLTPTPAMRKRVMATIRQPVPVSGSGIGRDHPRRRPRNSAVLAAAAAVAIVAIAAGLLLWRPLHTQDGAEPASVAAVTSAPDATTQTVDAAVGGTATLVVSHRENRMAFYLNGLPPLDGRHGYQIWLIGPVGPRSGGVLRDGAGGISHAMVTDLPADVHMVAVTTEPATGSSGPTTPVIVHIGIT